MKNLTPTHKTKATYLSFLSASWQQGLSYSSPKKSPFATFFILFLFQFLWLTMATLPTTWAQKTDYTDYKPSYRKWQDKYILDKISYTSDRTIFYFRYVSTYDYGSATFYGPKMDLAWFLKNTAKPSEAFDMIEIKNIAINGRVQLAALSTAVSKSFSSRKGDVFTCEVHFPRLPNSVKMADFIEGRGAERNENHFNCFDVKLKTWEDDLGTTDDLKETILKFEKDNDLPPSEIPIEEEPIKEKPEKIVEQPKEEDAEFARKFLEMVNELRSKGCNCGGRYFPPSKAVEWSEGGAKASKILVLKLAETDGMTSDAGGMSTAARLKNEGISTSKVYENLSYRFEEIEKAFHGWKMTPPQCMRMMDPNVKFVGAARKGKYWSMIMFY
ncbi:CAP domain-containing protein [Hugenholtzia roseola]|uniref:CAP domain-containing protein n=1 Tax=Hugenholtzia roseola TaxID=1002 RepID=UPI000421D0CD|nr:CAP domain-containing protein [Hugenholtzia roseola]